MVLLNVFAMAPVAGITRALPSDCKATVEGTLLEFVDWRAVELGTVLEFVDCNAAVAGTVRETVVEAGVKVAVVI